MAQKASPQSDLIVDGDEDSDGRLLDKIDEAADKLNVCERQIYRLVNAGVLESSQAGPVASDYATIDPPRCPWRSKIRPQRRRPCGLEGNFSTIRRLIASTAAPFPQA